MLLRVAILSRREQFRRVMKSRWFETPYVLIGTLGLYFAYEFLR
jgi:hypothetical protein